MSDPNFAMTSQTLPTETVVPTPALPDDEAAFQAAVDAARAAAPKPDPEPEPAPQVEAAPSTTATPAITEPAKPAAEASPPAETPKVAPVLLKLMEREAKVVERESAVKQFEQEVASIRQEVSNFETAQKNFKYDPISFIRQMAPDIDLAELAKQLWYEKLGDVAPPEYRATREARTVAGSVEQLRKEIVEDRQRWVEDRQREQAELAYNQYVGALNSFSKTVPESYPLVKHFAQSDPDSVQRGLLKIAQQHAQRNNGAVLTPDECASRLDSELKALQAKLPAPPAPAPVKNEQPVATTLRNKHTSIQPNRTAPDPEDEEALFQAALEAARAVRKQ